MTALGDRIAGAPITWGVCEAPGWGIQLPAERILREMSAVGLRATELGPEGFLPTDPVRTKELLDPLGMEMIGGFVPATLHREHGLEEELGRVAASADLLAALGASVLVLSATTGEAGYEGSADLDRAGWAQLGRAIDRVVGIGAERDLAVALHPHYGTLVETRAQVEAVLENTSVPLCIDTGHLLVGGADPVEVTDTFLDRVDHVHLKDVSADIAERVRAGRIGYHEAVRAGLYRPLGSGDVDVQAVVTTLEDAGYKGWYVLEQDAVIEEVPEEDEGPVRDAAASLEFLRRAAEALAKGVSA